MAAMRRIENSDLWAAIRGLGMYRMSYRELEQLRYGHAHPDKPFASQVIAEAARQVMASKRPATSKRRSPRDALEDRVFADF